jgi:hypothetical protein
MKKNKKTINEIQYTQHPVPCWTQSAAMKGPMWAFWEGLAGTVFFLPLCVLATPLIWSSSRGVGNLCTSRETDCSCFILLHFSLLEIALKTEWISRNNQKWRGYTYRQW